MTGAAAGGAVYLQLSAYAFVVALRTGNTTNLGIRDSAENGEALATCTLWEPKPPSAPSSNEIAPTLGAAPWCHRCLSFTPPQTNKQRRQPRRKQPRPLLTTAIPGDALRALPG